MGEEELVELVVTTDAEGAGDAEGVAVADGAVAGAAAAGAGEVAIEAAEEVVGAEVTVIEEEVAVEVGAVGAVGRDEGGELGEVMVYIELMRSSRGARFGQDMF